MSWRKARGSERLEDAAIRLVFAFALFVLHDASLLIEPSLIDDPEQMSHAVRFHPQGGIERRGRHVLEVVGAVEVRRAVERGGANLLERPEVLVVVMLGALEHQMFEQMRKTGLARPLVLRPDVIPDVDCDDG